MRFGNFDVKELLKRFCVRAATAVFLFALIFYPSQGRAFEKEITLAEITNFVRAAYKLSPLSVDPALNYAAQMKAESMARNGYFSHVSPTGETPWYWISKAGYRYEYAGENLAMNFYSPEDVEKAWLASPTHRANIMGKNYTEMGTGYAWGKYKGKKVIFIAQVYANPASS